MTHIQTLFSFHSTSLIIWLTPD